MNVPKNELTVVMKAKDICTYVITVTQKSPKQFRFTLVSRMQNLAMDIVENIYRANEVLIGRGTQSDPEKRLDFQHKALTSLKILAYFAEMAMTQKGTHFALDRLSGYVTSLLMISRRYTR
ncbi:MAG: four helix bundle protein [Clostridiales Family XIII bacterium]|jgi:hypothetical protein|nr:four helix bundle protein [Clostridiales Family XIII bacterium]